MRLALSVLVLGLPTFLMGGTLPAAVGAVVDADDMQRRSVGVLYGMNEFGAVLGAAISTFWLLEAIGTHATLLVAAACDAAAGLAALWLAGRKSPRVIAIETTATGSSAGALTLGVVAQRSPVLLYVTAAALGFAFLLMEMVWYRMLAPLLGGSTYTFGLILSLVLAGIGLGGWCYALAARSWRFGWHTLAFTIALEALGIALPLAIGDRLALFAAMISELKGFGFAGAVAGWILVAAPVVLPAAIVSGFQFPLLVSLAGNGDRHVERQVGNVLAWNTLGAIGGSLAGGFGLLPWLSAVGVWRTVAAALASLAIVSPLGVVPMAPQRRSDRGDALRGVCLGEYAGNRANVSLAQCGHWGRPIRAGRTIAQHPARPGQRRPPRHALAT